jgi:hypothetical protein
MFTSDPTLDAQVAPEDMQAEYAAIFQWYQDHDADISDGGAELMPIDTATTAKYGANGTVVVDGPFSEAKEVIGGFSIIDVVDMDAAIALAKTWPMLSRAGTAVEIRPIVTDYSQFES